MSEPTAAFRDFDPSKLSERSVPTGTDIDPADVAAVLAYDTDAVPAPVPPPPCQCPDARSWRKHMSPEWVAYREQQLDREVALRIRQASYDVRDAMFPPPARPGSEAAKVQAVLGSLADEGWEPVDG
jgi:hypothetical protein